MAPEQFDTLLSEMASVREAIRASETRDIKRMLRVHLRALEMRAIKAAFSPILGKKA